MAVYSSVTAKSQERTKVYIKVRKRGKGSNLAANTRIDSVSGFDIIGRPTTKEEEGERVKKVF